MDHHSLDTLCKYSIQYPPKSQGSSMFLLVIIKLFCKIYLKLSFCVSRNEWCYITSVNYCCIYWLIASDRAPFSTSFLLILYSRFIALPHVLLYVVILCFAKKTVQLNDFDNIPTKKVADLLALRVRQYGRACSIPLAVFEFSSIICFELSFHLLKDLLRASRSVWQLEKCCVSLKTGPSLTKG